MGETTPAHNAATTDAEHGELRPTGRGTSSLSKTMRDMLWTMLVVGAIVVALVIVNYRSPQDPVAQIDPVPVAEVVDRDAPYPVLLPSDPGWRATSARYEPTEESAGAPVWFVGGVLDGDSEFASLTQSTAGGERFIAEQTDDGSPAGTSTVSGVQWQRWESADHNSLVFVVNDVTTVVTGTVTWERLERFAASLRPL